MMKKVIIALTIFFFSTSYSYAYSEQGDKRWSNEDLFLFSAVITSQIADYFQSTRFNQHITKNECGYLDTPQFYDAGNGISGMTYYECTKKEYLMGEEINPLVRRNDGGFDQDRALLLATGLDASIFYIGTKYPKWRKPLLYAVYIIEIIAINNNHDLGFTADTPILPVFFVWKF